MSTDNKPELASDKPFLSKPAMTLLTSLWEAYLVSKCTLGPILRDEDTDAMLSMLFIAIRDDERRAYIEKTKAANDRLVAEAMERPVTRKRGRPRKKAEASEAQRAKWREQWYARKARAKAAKQGLNLSPGPKASKGARKAMEQASGPRLTAKGKRVGRPPNGTVRADGAVMTSNGRQVARAVRKPNGTGHVQAAH